MKVKIGRYIDPVRSNVYYNYMESKYGFNWPAESKETSFERFLENVEDALNWVYNKTINKIINRMEQKISVRIDPHDTWSMDCTLAHIIVPMIKQLKEEKHGSPWVDNEDVPEYLRSEDPNDTDDEKFHERWDWVMNEMIFAFESKLEDWEDQFHSGKIDMENVPIDKDGNKVSKEDAVLYEMKRTEKDTSSFDRDGYIEYQKRITNGFRLFGKYYEGLWD